ncbi:tryptophan-rich sensory protein [Polaribacter sp.]|nr:tryptophan-rich sensory protein [Polaribacter sp.]|tara:strand:- start:2097 stop:2558 length:462 start_codon:yes stop_codon:yes gene_type:complete
MKFTKAFLFFMVVNFGGLAIGSWLMDGGPTSLWYTTLNQAPWTPPGIVFGIAWTTIMVLFSIYLGILFQDENTQKNKILYGFQVILNVSWNFLFFNQHLVLLALINILFLTAIVFYFFFKGSKKTTKIKYLLLPYMIWLCIATSLNLYILIHN